jgi:PPK2 family polyphosphate:nucleotide phosphotransferase
MGKGKGGKKKAKADKALVTGGSATPFSDALRVRSGYVLAEWDPRSTPAFTGDKVAGQEAVTAADDEMGELQEKLYATGTAGGRKRLLLVIQGMDTSGKGGIMRHVVGSVDPQGVQITAFKKPTAEELSHPFLWRIRKALPGPGKIGVFDRSHYEDVLVVRVHDLVPRSQWSRRYTTINNFEQELVEDEVTVVKVMLHISKEEQGARLQERLDRPDKHWKYNPGDVDERMHWAAYQEAYQAVLDKTSTDVAPWYVVPADRKWYARLAVQQLLLEHLRALDLTWPEADFDVEAEKERLAAS